MLYNLVDAQRIRAIMNTRVTAYAPAPQATTIPTLIPSPTPDVEILTLTPELYQLAEATTTLSMG